MRAWIPAKISTGALLVGIFALGINIIGASRPSLWFDEAATIAGSARPVNEILALLGHVDRVHGLYYLLMHFWFEIVPATEFWARVPSAIMVGAAAAGVVVLGRQFSVRVVAVAAGVVFAILPRTTWAGIEARPYALAIAAAVWTTVLFVTATRRQRMWMWSSYSAALVISALVNVLVLLIVAVHASVLAHARSPRRVVVAWLVGVLAAAAVVAPHIRATTAQQGQVSWIWPVGPGTLGQFLGDQYFPAVHSARARALGPATQQAISAEQISAAVEAWTLVAPIIVSVVALGAAALWMRKRSVAAVRGDVRSVVCLSASWILVPTAIVVVYSLVERPLYQPHYLAFTTPAMALLVGLCVVIVGRGPRRIAALLVILCMSALPNYIAQRGRYAKFGMDHSAVADLIAERAAPGDCLNIDDTTPKALLEAMKGGRPRAYAELRDAGEDFSAQERDSLFEARMPIAAWAHELRHCQVLWTVTERDDTLPDREQGEWLSPGPRLAHVAAYQIPAERGFRIVARWQFNLSQVVRMVSPPSHDRGWRPPPSAGPHG